MNPKDWTTIGGVFIMAKFSYEDKKEIIRLYNEEHYGCKTIAKKYNVNYTTILRIVRKYLLHGEASLKKCKNRKFTAEIKLEVIHRAMNGESKKSLGIEYMIQEAQIISWLKNYEEFGYNGLIDKHHLKSIPVEHINHDHKPSDIHVYNHLPIHQHISLHHYNNNFLAHDVNHL